MRRYTSQRTRKNRIPSAITYKKSASVAVIWSPIRPKRLKIIANIVVITIANGYHSINATRHCQNEFLNVMRRSGFSSIFQEVKPITTHRRGVVINISQYTKHLLLESLPTLLGYVQTKTTAIARKLKRSVAAVYLWASKLAVVLGGGLGRKGCRRELSLNNTAHARGVRKSGLSAAAGPGRKERVCYCVVVKAAVDAS
jgi:hypothetical protein